MKKILCIAIAITIFGCKEEVKPDYAIISGKIINKLPGDVTINTDDRVISDVVAIADDGTFLDTLSLNYKSYILFDGKNPVFLDVEPGFNLNITYDAKDFDNTIAITGIGSEINNYIVAKNKQKKERRKYAQEIFTLDEAAYKEKMQAFKEKQEALLMSTKGLPEAYIQKEKKELHYAYLMGLNSYERAHKYYTKNEDFKISENFLKEVNEVDYTNLEDFNTSPSFKGLTTDYFKKKAEDLMKSDLLSFDIAFLKTASSIENETIKNTLLFDFANNSITRAKDIDEFYNLFKANSTNAKNNEIIDEKYNKLMALTEGRPSPKFVDYENYAGGTTSLDDLKGKYVYVDVWATWCGPCKREIPYLKEVEEKYHGKNIEFVSISIDKLTDHEKWKTMVDEKELGGIQLFADNDWNSDFVKNYQIQGIPRFILIDAEGNIVNSNAPRPSSEALIKLFDERKI